MFPYENFKLDFEIHVKTFEAGKHFSVHRGRHAGRFLQPSGGALEENLVVLGVVFRVIVNVCFCESISLLDIRCQMMFGTVASRKLDQRVDNKKQRNVV